MTDSFEQLIDAKTAAKLLCISPKTIYQLALRREIESVRMGRCVRFQRQAIRRYVEDHIEGGGE